jgi:hypothetical protein
VLDGFLEVTGYIGHLVDHVGLEVAAVARAERRLDGDGLVELELLAQLPDRLLQRLALPLDRLTISGRRPASALLPRSPRRAMMPPIKQRSGQHRDQCAPTVRVARRQRRPHAHRAPSEPRPAVQDAIDMLVRDGAVEVTVEAIGPRSAFIGAVLATLPGVVVSRQPPRRVTLRRRR